MIRSLLSTLLSAALLAGTSSLVHGQKDQPAKPKTAQQAATPQSEAPAPPQSGWRSNCTSIARADPPDCTVEQRLVLSNTGQLLTAVTIRIDGKTRQPALMVQLPHGLFLPDGISLRVDQAEALKLDVQTCDNSGCYAGSPASKKLLGALSSGSQLKVSFNNLAKKEVQLTLPLMGFAAALAKAK